MKQKRPVFTTVCQLITIVSLCAVLLFPNAFTHLKDTSAWLIESGEAPNNVFIGSPLTITLSANQSSQIYPGMNVDLANKATITVPANQPNCYVFVKVTKANDTNNIVTWAMGQNFINNNLGDGIYRSDKISTNATSAQTLAVFSSNQLTISTSATLAQIQAATTTSIKVTIQACAVQADNITEAQALAIAKEQLS